MQDIFTISNIFLVVLVAFIGILVYLLRNVLLKVEKYEDILVNQTEFINQLSEIIKEGENGIIIPTKNSEILQQKMKLLTKSLIGLS